MSDIPPAVTAAEVKPVVVADSPVTVDVATDGSKASDLGDFHPASIEELHQRVQVLEGEVAALKAAPAGNVDMTDVHLLRKQMDYLANTYVREQHFPRE